MFLLCTQGKHLRLLEWNLDPVHVEAAMFHMWRFPMTDMFEFCADFALKVVWHCCYCGNGNSCARLTRLSASDAPVRFFWTNSDCIFFTGSDQGLIDCRTCLVNQMTAHMLTRIGVPILSVSLLSIFESLVPRLLDSYIKYLGPVAYSQKHKPSSPKAVAPDTLPQAQGQLSLDPAELCQRSDWLTGGAFPFLNKCLCICL